MPNIAAVLREEIARLARKEIRKGTAAVQKASSQYRRDIAALKRQVAGLQRQLSLLEGKVLAQPGGSAPVDGSARVRFSAKGLRSQRKRLGLSAVDCARLVGVSTQSMRNWERGATRPRREQVLALAALRTIGKTEAQARLRQIAKQGEER